MSVLCFPSINDSLEKLAGQAALQSLTITAIAIRRYQNDHTGQPPETLTNLLPSYLATLPVDPMNGEPLRYQRQGDHFLLYAVGENGVDDGGDPSPIPGKKFRGPSDALDIVWPRAVVYP